MVGRCKVGILCRDVCCVFLCFVVIGSAGCTGAGENTVGNGSGWHPIEVQGGTEQDLGSYGEPTLASEIVQLKNVSSEVVKLDDKIATTCGFTSCVLASTELEPNETTDLKVGIETGSGNGTVQRVTAKIQVVSPDEVAPVVVVFTARSAPRWSVNPGKFSFICKPGDKRKYFVELLGRSDCVTNLLGVESTVPGVEDQSRSVGLSHARSTRLEFTMTAPLDVGSYEYAMKLITDDESVPYAEVPVRVIVESDCRVVPSRINYLLKNDDLKTPSIVRKVVVVTQDKMENPVVTVSGGNSCMTFVRNESVFVDGLWSNYFDIKLKPSEVVDSFEAKLLFSEKGEKLVELPIKCFLLGR